MNISAIFSDFKTKVPEFFSSLSPLQKKGALAVTGIALGILGLYAYLNRSVVPRLQRDVEVWNNISEKTAKPFDLIKTTEAHLVIFEKEAERRTNVDRKLQGLKVLERLDKVLREADKKRFPQDLYTQTTFWNRINNTLCAKIAKLRECLGLQVQKPLKFEAVYARDACAVGGFALDLLQEKISITRPKPTFNTPAKEKHFEIGLSNQLRIAFKGELIYDPHWTDWFHSDAYDRFAKAHGEFFARRIALLSTPEHFNPFIENCLDSLKAQGLQVKREVGYEERHFVTITQKEDTVIFSMAIAVKIEGETPTARILKRKLSISESLLNARNQTGQVEGKDFISDEIINYETALALLEQEQATNRT